MNITNKCVLMNCCIALYSICTQTTKLIIRTKKRDKNRWGAYLKHLANLRGLLQAKIISFSYKGSVEIVM